MTLDRQAEMRTPPQMKSTLTAAVRSLLVFAACVLGIPHNADAGTIAVVGSAYGANDAAAALSGLSEGSRHNAIASMVRSGQLQGPLSAADGVLILSGTSQHIRSASIAELARLFKADLTGQEAATIFGPAAGLSEGDRHGAIAALARAKRFGPSLGGDAGLALNGTTQHIRAASIAALAPYLRTDMRSQQIVEILGIEQALNEGDRHGAIAALARAKRIPQALTAAEAVPILAGTTSHIRAASIAELARFFATALSGEDVAAILGRNGETTEGDRLSAIAALARAGKLRPGFNGHELTLVLQGMSDQSRAAAIGEISASAVKLAAAAPRGPSPTTNATQAQSAASAQSFDGTYYNAQLAFGFRITGNQGITTVSNSPAYKPGDIMLRFTPSGPKSFTGEQFCADGVFHPVTAALTADGSLDMTIQGCLPNRYTMVREATVQAATEKPATPISAQVPSTPTPDAGFSFKDRLLLYAIGESTPKEKRICEVLPYAELASWAYSIRGGVSVSMPGNWAKVQGYELADRRTGLKAALFKHPKTKELVLFFAGTDPTDFSRAIERVRTQLPDFAWYEKLQVWRGDPEMWTRLALLQREIKSGAPIEKVILSASRIPAQRLLSDDIASTAVYIAIGASFGIAPDTSADVNIAYPRMDNGARGVFEQARGLFDRWDLDAKLGKIDPSNRNGIAFVGGHSLGGAVAQAVGLSRSVPAITFNSAPVPLDPDYRNAIGFDRNRFDMLHVRAVDDPLTRTVDLLESDKSVKSWVAELVEGVYVQRGNILGEPLKRQYEEVIQRNDFYAGTTHRLILDSRTGHGIAAMVEALKKVCP